MIRLLAAALVAAALLVPSHAGIGAPAPPRAAPAAVRLAGTPMATICSTEQGWCPITVVVLPGTPCKCAVLPARLLPAVARFFRYEPPVDPHLNPQRQ